MSLALVNRKAALLAPWNRNELWRRARAVPSLDLRFADNKSLVDATTGQNLVSFTRASSGTYVDSQGVIRTATTNLLLRSEEFGDASWTKGNASIIANFIAAPNGTLTGAKVVEDTVNATHYARRTTSQTINTNPITFSVYVKAAERTYVGLAIQEATTFTRQANVNFDLGNGTANAVSNIGGASASSTTITAVGNGWYRCTLTTTLGGTDANVFSWIYVSTSGGLTYTGNGTSGIYIWGAQLEQSSTVGEYIPTTSTINSAPRFDHNPTTGESLGLLVEESRTNLWTYSEGLDDASWIKTSLSGTITTNQTTAPDGLNTADLYQENTNTIGRFLGKALSSTSGTSYTVTIWAKQAPGATRYAGLVLPAANFGVNVIASYTLSGAGSVTIAASGTGTSASIQQFPNGWYRCSLTSQATITTSGNIQFRISNSAANGAATYAGDGSSGLYFWGAQIEVGAFPTSYIPTTAATATRSADVASISGSNFSSWYRQDEGTVFAEFNRPATVAGLRSITAVSDGGFNNRMTIRTDSAVAINLFVITGGVNQATFPLGINSGVDNKAALAYAGNDINAGANGAIGINDTANTVPVVDRISIGSVLNAEPSCSYVRRLTYWPQRLSNSTLSSITQ